MPDYHQVLSRIESNDSLSVAEIGELLGSSDGYLRWAGLKAWGSQKIEQLPPAFASAVRQSERGPDLESLTTVAAWALSQMPNVANQFILKHGGSQEEGIRILISDLLGLVDHPGDVSLLRQLLLDQSEKVSKWAALSLSKKGAVAAPLLKELLVQSKDDRLIALCLDALKKIGSIESRQIARDYVAAPGRERFAIFSE